MSYSFTVFAASKAQAKAMVEAKLDEATVSQPAHRIDRDRALATAQAYIDLIEEPAEGQQLSVSVTGELICAGSDQEIVNARVAVTVGTMSARAIPAAAA